MRLPASPNLLAERRAGLSVFLAERLTRAAPAVNRGIPPCGSIGSRYLHYLANEWEDCGPGLPA